MSQNKLFTNTILEPSKNLWRISLFVVVLFAITLLTYSLCCPKNINYYLKNDALSSEITVNDPLNIFWGSGHFSTFNGHDLKKSQTLSTLVNEESLNAIYSFNTERYTIASICGVLLLMVFFSVLIKSRCGSKRKNLNAQLSVGYLLVVALFSFFIYNHINGNEFSRNLILKDSHSIDSKTLSSQDMLAEHQFEYILAEIESETPNHAKSRTSTNHYSNNRQNVSSPPPVYTNSNTSYQTSVSESSENHANTQSNNEPCPLCGGDGRCVKVNAQPVEYDFYCRGNKICQVCGGDGLVTGFTGIYDNVPCSHCYTERHLCGSCKGTGLCSMCHGTKIKN